RRADAVREDAVVRRVRLGAAAPDPRLDRPGRRRERHADRRGDEHAARPVETERLPPRDAPRHVVERDRSLRDAVVLPARVGEGAVEVPFADEALARAGNAVLARAAGRLARSAVRRVGLDVDARSGAELETRGGALADARRADGAR